jgi:hypothetical protein
MRNNHAAVKSKIRKWFFIFFVLFLSGCANLQKPTKTEKEQVEKFKEIKNIYRTEGKKPPLPVLTSKSTLQDYIRYAIYNNPAIEKTFYQWEKNVKILPVYRYAPNPQFSLEEQITSGMMNNVLPPLMTMPGIMLSYPAKKKLYFLTEAMALKAKEKQYIFQKEILKTAFTVKYFAYQYWITNKKIKLTENIINTLESMENITLTKIQTGNNSLLDVIDIQIEIQKFKNILANLKDYKHVLRVEFAQVLGINPYLKNIRLPPMPENLPFTNTEFKESKIWNTVKKHNPTLALLKTGIQQAEAFVSLAYSQSKINFGVSLMQSIFSSMSLTEPLITLSIPWRQKIMAEISASKSGEKEAKASFSAQQLELAAMLADGLFRWRQANRAYLLYKTSLIPEIKAVMQIETTSYQTGNASIEKFLKAQNTYFNFYSNYFSSMAMREINLNEISLIIAGIVPKGAKL